MLLAGNCNTSLGMVAALSSTERRVGLVWLDAHGDFNTTDTDPGGFLDGHGLAMAVGRCWPTLTATVPGFAPLPEHDVLLVGARSLDQDEGHALHASQVIWLAPHHARDPEQIRDALRRLRSQVDLVHIHVDLDVHDPSAVAPANSYAAPDGLTAHQVRAVVRDVADHLPIGSATLASYDPAYDPASRMQATALDLLALLAGLATSPPSSRWPRAARRTPSCTARARTLGRRRTLGPRRQRPTQVTAIGSSAKPARGQNQ